MTQEGRAEGSLRREAHVYLEVRSGLHVHEGPQVYLPGRDTSRGQSQIGNLGFSLQFLSLCSVINYESNMMVIIPNNFNFSYFGH